MTTILDLLGATLATTVLATTGVTHAPPLLDIAKDAYDVHISGAQIQQTALEIGRQVEKANTLSMGAGPAIAALTCANEKCSVFAELEGFKLARSPGDVTFTPGAGDTFTVTVTTPRGLRSAAFDSGTQRVVVAEHEPTTEPAVDEESVSLLDVISWDAARQGFDLWISGH